jgi:hypothetical protein
MTFKKGLISLMIFGFSLLSFGQNEVKAPTNLWFTMLNEIKVKNAWQITMEVHERFANPDFEQGQFLLRPSIDYRFNDGLTASFGYSFINVQAYSPYSLPIARNENNLWEQLLFKFSVGKVQFQNRLRQENRWVPSIVDIDSVTQLGADQYSNRFRFRMTAKRDLISFSGEKALFTQLFDELWLGQNKWLVPNKLSRNWFYAGLGYSFSKKSNFQIGYMNQVDQLGDGSYINTPIIQTTFVRNF